MKLGSIWSAGIILPYTAKVSNNLSNLFLIRCLMLIDNDVDNADNNDDKDDNDDGWWCASDRKD